MSEKLPKLTRRQHALLSKIHAADDVTVAHHVVASASLTLRVFYTYSHRAVGYRYPTETIRRATLDVLCEAGVVSMLWLQGYYHYLRVTKLGKEVLGV